MGKSSINGPFSMAMLNNQRVYPFVDVYHIFLSYCMNFPFINGPFKLLSFDENNSGQSHSKPISPPEKGR